MAAIEAKDLAKVYDSFRRKRSIVALDGVTLAIEPGEIFGLLGPNGAGKTTFLKVLLGITQPTTGTVTIANLPPSDPRSREEIGYLPENPHFPPYLTGLGLLELAGRLQGMPRADIGSRADHLLALVEMDRWANVKTRKYSKGMLQRIGLAQALMGDPDVLLLDEPTDGIDPVGKVAIRQVLERLREEGKTIVLNSHLLSEVEAVADRVAILSRGKLIRISSVEEFTRRASQFEVEADIGNQILEIPQDIGKIISISTRQMTVELTNDENINHVIDYLRLKKVSIRSVRPLKVSLERSFLETVAASGENAP
ncbi:MAG TPA: ABC transporter ATP-binding protein [Candidatus Deferrimicrobium sp.]|nr:ABC transporter ATP-binding protein [Candidatus Deferrimicrobium sp.]